jgi:S1-C subfamily serine protease
VAFIEVSGHGSGFFTPDGYALTNSHMVRGASTVTVTTADGQEFAAQVVGTDVETGLAVIRAQAGGLPFLRLGDSSRLQQIFQHGRVRRARMGLAAATVPLPRKLQRFLGLEQQASGVRVTEVTRAARPRWPA